MNYHFGPGDCFSQQNQEDRWKFSFKLSNLVVDSHADSPDCDMVTGAYPVAGSRVLGRLVGAGIRLPLV